jgi:putative hemolysin
MGSKFPELTYANPTDPWLKRWTIRAVERASGRNYFIPLYEYWRSEIVPKRTPVIRPMLDLIDVDLELTAGTWPPNIRPETPLVIVANHPYGILDGIAALSLAEDLGRPFKVLINKDLMKVPEIRPYSLAVDFSETREAQADNIRTRNEALRLLKAGTTIVVFPAGGVATASGPFGRAVDLPWKTFTARMVQAARASVLPVHFEGQCGPLFQFVSRYSATLRLSLIIREFRRLVGLPCRVRIGDVVAFETLTHRSDRKALTRELYARVHALNGESPPSQDGLPRWLAGN